MLDTNSVASAAGDAIGLPSHNADWMEPTDVPASLIDVVRTKAAELRELLQRIETQIDEQHQHAKATGDIDEMQRLQDADPYRWHADAKHALQSGVMFAERAVTQPLAF